MEAWVTVAVALIVALSTLGATFLQNRHSTKRFEKELERAREADYRERKREVRGEPLIRLRDELARMAAKQNKVASDAFGDSAEQLEKAINDWNNYLASGNLLQTLFLQYDVELFNKVNEIQKKYIAYYKNTERPSEKIWPKVIEVQELINKRLEEL